MSETQGVQTRSSPFNPVFIAAVVFVGVIAFVAHLAGSAFDSGPSEKFDSRPHATSKSAIGFAGAVQLLNRIDRPTIVARGPVPNQAKANSLLIITLDDDDPQLALSDLPTMKDFPGPILAILPKWEVEAHESTIGWVRKDGLRKFRVDSWLRPNKKGGKIDIVRDPGSSVHSLRAIRSGYLSEPVATGMIDRFQTFTPAPGWEPLVIDEQGRAVVVKGVDSPFHALSEPDLLNTQGLRQVGNARAGLMAIDAASQLGAGVRGVIFDLTLHGYERSRSLLKLAFQPPFLAATLTVLAAAMLMGWHAFFRFGREGFEDREFALGKRALADNQAALIHMAGREHRLGGRYGILIRDLAARAVGAPRDLTPEALDAFLDRIGENGRTSWALSVLRHDIEQAADTADLVRTAGRLHNWRLEMTRERE